MSACPSRLPVLLLLAAAAAMPGRGRAQTTSELGGTHRPTPTHAAHPAAAPRPAPHEAPAHPTERRPVVRAEHGPVRHPPPAHAATHPAVHPAPPAPAPAPAPAVPAKPAAPTMGSNTGLPLPRFAALRTDDVNLRAGPGTRYPIDWVYKRRDLPVEVEREFDVWRLVRDSDGVQGWVHQATLGPRRTVVVTGAERVMRASASADAAAVARLQPGVIGRLRGCAAGSDWCDVSVGDYRGFLRRDEIWGLLPGEAVP